MEQLKYSLGPFELFASMVGGAPFVLAVFLLYNPVESLADLIPIIQNNGTVAISLTILFLSYVVGGTVQGLSWRYFLWLCKLFKKNYLYFDDRLTAIDRTLKQSTAHKPNLLEFDERVVLKLREKIGIPKNLNWMNSRLKSYLREQNSPSVAAADTFIASHIMYRNLSLGCLILCIVNLINAIRLGALELLVLITGLGYAATLMFWRSISFKRWQNRTLILGFYFSDTKNSETTRNY
ncbi:MAG: hypothetical protein ACFB2W_01590 [Leptolyngbyaceae cyanobacterium]